MKRTWRIVIIFGLLLIVFSFALAWAQNSTPESVLKRAQGLLEAYKAASEQPQAAPKIVGDPNAFKTSETVLFYDGFENGSANWTIDAGSEWEIGAPTYETGPSAHGGSNVAGTNLDGTYSSQYTSITSAPIQIDSRYGDISLEFYLWYELVYDYMYVELSTDGGNWVNILPKDKVPYGYMYDSGADDIYYQKYFRKQWNLVSCDLSQYSGQQIQIRFRLYASYGGNNASYGHNEAGMYVDDVSVVAGGERGNPVVRVMPEYYTWPGKESIFWGAVVPDNGLGFFNDVTYSWNFGDGTDPVTGTVDNLDSITGNDARFMTATHTYENAGTKTATLTVTVGGASKPAVTFSKSVRINVQIDNLETRRLKAIEDGLRWLYTQSRVDGSIAADNVSSEEIMGLVGLNVLAFEEQGHYAGNNPDTDIYAPVVANALNYVVKNAKKFTFAEKASQPVHPGEPDTNGNGYGFHLGSGSSPNKYETGINMLTVIASRTPTQVIAEGEAAGMTYKELIQEVIDYFAYTQCDTTQTSGRGGWRYYVEPNYDSDNSAAQWPALGMMAAESEWGCYVPQWVKDENLIWLKTSQSQDGGFGYTSVDYWVNMAKTGSGVCQLAFIGKKADDSMVSNALSWMDAHWSETSLGYYGGDGQFNNVFYALYAVTKGCRSMSYSNGDKINSIGSHNWWNEYVNFLVNDSSYSQDAQWEKNGKWSDDYWRIGTMSTALAVLVLSPGLYELPPVAVINAPNGSRPDVDVQFSGENSFHQDSNKSIVEWLWDFDKSDGINWDDPDAVGTNVVKTGGYSITADTDTFYVTLRVKDNSEPSMFDTEEVMFVISREANHPPIAVAGGPYTGRPGETIQLDGTHSYDPDPGDSIVKYEWDLNGDGQYDDSTDSRPTITWNEVKEGMVGVRVTDQNGLYSDDRIPVYVKIWTSQKDLAIEGEGLVLSSTSPVADETLSMAVSGVYISDTNETLDSLIVRFYNGNPDSSYILIGDYTVRNVSTNDTFTASVNWVVPDKRKSTIWVKLDYDNQVNEYDETNNTDSVFIGGGEPGETKVTLYFNPDPARIIGSGAVPTIVSLSVSGVIDLFAARVELEFDQSKVNVISMTPGEFFTTNSDEPSDLSSFDNAAGTITIQLARMGGNPAGVSGTGSIMDIKFKGMASDPTSAITFTSYILRDSNNNSLTVDSTDNGSFVGISSLLGDFDNNMTVDFTDYTQFIIYWNASNMKGDIAGEPGSPNMAGLAPWSKDTYLYDSDGTIDFEDQVVFALMYNWYKSVTSEGAAKPVVAAKQAPSVYIAGLTWDKKDFTVGDTFVISLNPGEVNNFIGAEMVLTYNTAVLKVNDVRSGYARSMTDIMTPVQYKVLHGNLTASTVVLGNLRKGIAVTGENLFDIEFEVIGEGVFSVNLANFDVRNFRNNTLPLKIGNTVISGKIGTGREAVQLAFGLTQNYPNPFNMSTTIAYGLVDAGTIDIRIYNSLGQEIKSLVNDLQPPGQYSVVWNGTDNHGSAVTSGVYFVRLKQGNRTDSKQLLMIK